MELGTSHTSCLPATAAETRPSAQDALAASIFRFSSGLLILGTARFVCALGDNLSSLLQMTGFAIPPFVTLSVFFAQNHPSNLLASCWPLILALALRQTGGRVFLGASALTFSVVSAVGLLELLAGLTLGNLSDLHIGSFAVPVWLLKLGHPATAVQAILGSIQLTLELAAAVLAWILAREKHRVEARHLGEAGSLEAGSLTPREQLYGRLAIYVSLAFLAIGLRIPVWSAYFEILNRSELVRGLVAKISVPARVANQNRPANLPGPRPQEMELQMLTTGALKLNATDRYSECKEAYLKVIAKAEALSRDGEPAAIWKTTLALALNNLAWMLVTCEDAKLWQPEDAVTYAKRAVDFFPNEGNYWNTLGVTYVRVGQWERAKEALKRSMELSGGSQGDGHDWFFLAIIHARNGEAKEAHLWYDRAVTWFHKQTPNDQELYRFQVEAARALGLPTPLAPNATAR